jgi:uncharacterized protein YkwD
MKTTPATPHFQLERLKKSLVLSALLGLGLVGCTSVPTVEPLVQPEPMANPVTPTKPDPKPTTPPPVVNNPQPDPITPPLVVPPVTPPPVAPPATPAPTLSLSHSSVVLEANGSNRQAFQATLTNSSETLNWTLSPNLGSLSSSTGANVTYTSPSSVAVETTVTIRVQGAGIERTASILLKPVPVVVVPPPTPVIPAPTLNLTPSSGVVLTANGSTQQPFQATLTNSSATLNWTLSPNLGTLSGNTGANVTYTSPSSVSVDTTVTLKVQGAGIERTATILLKPVPVVVAPQPTLSLTPSSVTLTAGDTGKTFQAALTNSSATLNWTLSPNLGTLSGNTGTSVTYTPPSVSSVTAQTVVTLKVVGAGLERSATITLNPAPIVIVDTPAPTPSDSQTMLSAINAVRAQGRNCGSTAYPAVPALKWNAMLERTALLHSQDMANRNYFDHTNPEGKEPWDRMTAQGYLWSAAGENIAAGQRTLQAVMQGWVDSAGHCKNLMSPGFTEVGMARFDKAGTPYGAYWTQVFGKPR